MAQKIGVVRDNNLVGTSVTNSPIGVHDIFCLPGSNRMEGRTGDDRLFGGPGEDQLLRSLGDDLLLGQDDDDLLFGGDGDDELLGNARDDFLFGNEGTELFLGEHGSDTLFGGPGDDHLRGGISDDLLFGRGSGDDFLDDTSDGNAFFGRAGEDRCGAVSEDNTLDGSSDNDLLTSALAFARGCSPVTARTSWPRQSWVPRLWPEFPTAWTAKARTALPPRPMRAQASVAKRMPPNTLPGGYGRDRLTAEATADIDAFRRTSTSNKPASRR
jgi:Ca2+-binding RTX toxin-like protein